MSQEAKLRNPGQQVCEDQFDSDFDGRGAGEYSIRELATLTRYLGYPTLGEGLARNGIKRCVEVGVGWVLESVMIEPLARLHFNGKALFTPRDVWAIDPALRTDKELLQIRRLGKYKDLFIRVPISAEELREQIVKGAVPPFDLVISTGVVAGGSTLFSLSNRQEYETGLAIIKSMRDCLNPQNPNAILALFDYYMNPLIPCAPSHLTELGLKIVYGKESTGEEVKDWQWALQNSGLVPPTENIFYSEVICQVA